MTYFEAFILAIVEGITEFLPISSTGHMILVSNLMGIENSDLLKVFTVNIQFGAILSVVVLYWKRFFQTIDFYFKLLAAFIPTAIVGFLLNDFIDGLLENVLVFAIMLILGGIVLVFVDGWFKDKEGAKEITYLNSIKIGFYQCIAMVPGVSRSAATIIGGMTQGWNRKQAAEFSFLLAVPTMFAASAYKLLKSYKSIESGDIQLLVCGNVVAFIVGVIAIKFFIDFLSKYGFKYFGYYRIIIGLSILILILLGIDLRIV